MNSFIFDGAEILLAVFALYQLRNTLSSTLHFSPRAMRLALLYGIGYGIALFGLGYTTIGHSSFTLFIQSNLMIGSVWLLIGYALIMILSEELFFRVYLLHTKIPSLIAATLFAAVHWRPGHAFPILMFLLLVVFALMQWALYKKTNNFWALCLAHLMALAMLVILYG